MYQARVVLKIWITYEDNSKFQLRPLVGYLVPVSNLSIDQYLTFAITAQITQPAIYLTASFLQI